MAKSFSKDTPSLFGVIFGLLVSGGMIYLYFAYLVPELQIGLEVSIIYYIIALVIYVVISYVLHPQVDYQNMGIFGGLFDDPTQEGDDINRALDFFKKLLYPGKIIAWSLIGVVKLFQVEDGGINERTK